MASFSNMAAALLENLNNTGETLNLNTAKCVAFFDDKILIQFLSII